MRLSTRLNTRTLMCGLIILGGIAALGFGPQAAVAGELHVDNHRCQCVDVYLNGAFMGTVKDHGNGVFRLHVCPGQCGDIKIATHNGAVLLVKKESAPALAEAQ